MRGRWSVFSHLGVLELENGQLTLRDTSGTPLFAVPAASVRTSSQRRIAVHQVFFRIHAVNQWWYLVAHVPTKHQRRTARELIERFHIRELVPRPAGMGEADYARVVASPSLHQVLWAAYWLTILPNKLSGENRGPQHEER